MEALLTHEAYDSSTPNNVYALLGGFAMANPSGFHDQSGRGYDLITDQIMYLDNSNPSVAARLVMNLFF